jgi:DNA-binding response OmpR family regulator
MKKIVITDDDPGIQDIFKIIFKSAGYDATILSNGDAILKNELDTPDIFLLDSQLSGVNGLELCKLLKTREATRNVPVIMISANPAINTLSDKAGADDAVQKPFRIHELLNVVSRHLSVSART